MASFSLVCFDKVVSSGFIHSMEEWVWASVWKEGTVLASVPCLFGTAPEVYQRAEMNGRHPSFPF